jgi:hypothetical protein
VLLVLLSLLFRSLKSIAVLLFLGSEVGLVNVITAPIAGFAVASNALGEFVMFL